MARPRWTRRARSPTFSSLWCQPEFLKFWAGQSVSLFGTQFSLLATPGCGAHPARQLGPDGVHGRGAVRSSARVGPVHRRVAASCPPKAEDQPHDRPARRPRDRRLRGPAHHGASGHRVRRRIFSRWSADCGLDPNARGRSRASRGPAPHPQRGASGPVVPGAALVWLCVLPAVSSQLPKLPEVTGSSQAVPA